MRKNWNNVIFDAVADAVFITDARGLILEEKNDAGIVVKKGVAGDGYLQSLLCPNLVQYLEIYVRKAEKLAVPQLVIFNMEMRLYECRIFPSLAGFVFCFNELKNVGGFGKECTDFVVKIGHDLRQPIQAMRMFSHSLQKERLTAKQKELVQGIDASADNLSYLLDNLVDMSRLDSGGEKTHSFVFELDKLIKKLVKEFSFIAKKNKIKFEVKSEKIKIDSDPFYIERILRNILSNAFKFTKDVVELTVKKDTGGSVVLSVKDNGIGISKSEEEDIFGDFYQAKNVEKKYGGMGLGLAIAKKLADIIGARVEVKSKDGEGSEFVVVVPIKKT